MNYDCRKLGTKLAFKLLYYYEIVSLQKRTYIFYHLLFCYTGKDVFSPEVESSPAPSSIEPQNIPVGVKQTSRTSSFEIENLLKTAEQVINALLLCKFSNKGKLKLYAMHFCYGIMRFEWKVLFSLLEKFITSIESKSKITKIHIQYIAYTCEYPKCLINVRVQLQQ